MNKLIFSLIAAIVVGGGILFVSSSTPRRTPKPEKVAMQAKENSVVNSFSRYIEYSKESYNKASPKRRVLYFYASWCPTCKAANADFTANPDKIPEDAVVIRVNYNDPDTDQEEKALAKRYGITYQHTFVQVNSAGKEVTLWNGGDTNELNKNIK